MVLPERQGKMYPDLRATIRDPLTGLDRIRLARFPTPIEHAPRLARQIGVKRLWIKREDMSGYALGGNKLRQIDFIVASALKKDAAMLVATAGSQSNFCRSLAGAAARLGLGCHLHLRAKTGTGMLGNLLLDDVFGAKVTFTERTDPWDPAIADELSEIALDYERQGIRAEVIQLTGVTASLGVAGWASAAAELSADFEAIGETPDYMVVTSGSGLTLAGLALGFKRVGLGTRLVGVSAQQPASRLRQWIVDTTNRAACDLGWECGLAATDFDIVDSTIGPGYGLASERSVEMVRLAGSTEGLVLDPIYTGKGLAGLCEALRNGIIDKETSVIFLHSGGTPGLFMHAAAFAPGAR